MSSRCEAKTVGQEAGAMETADLIESAFAMPLTSPSFPRAVSLQNRGYLIITYHIDRAELRS
jgi:acetoacetate decarboxylase